MSNDYASRLYCDEEWNEPVDMFDGFVLEDSLTDSSDESEPTVPLSDASPVASDFAFAAGRSLFCVSPVGDVDELSSSSPPLLSGLLSLPDESTAWTEEDEREFQRSCSRKAFMCLNHCSSSRGEMVPCMQHV